MTQAVGRDARISGAQTNLRSESDIRLDFGDPRRIIAASNASGASQAQFFSGNGGVTWGQSMLNLVGNDQLHSDPTVDWTSDGTAWATTIGIQFDLFGSVYLFLRAYRSANGGQTWVFDGTISGTQNSAGKELMWVDHSPTSPFRDTIYVIWHNDAPVFMNRRTRASGAWGTPLQISGPETTGTRIGGDITSNVLGEVFAFWHDTVSQSIFMAKSTNGGASFGAPVRVATTFGDYLMGVPASNSNPPFIYVSAAAYRDALNNFVYAIWTDLTGAAGCMVPTEAPGGNAASMCKTRIWFTRSLDGGATWQRPTILNDSPARNDQFNPRLAVDESDGTLVVVYYDTFGDATRLRTNLWYQSSGDNGTTWSQPTKVTTATTDETTAGSDPFQYGDYNGLSGNRGTFFPSWTDRRLPASREEIWSAALSPDTVTDWVLAGLSAHG
jgi:BNR repeat-like domain